MHLFNGIIFFIALFAYTKSEKPSEGFVYLNNLAPDIAVDLRYFSSNNFVGDTINGYHAKKCILSEEAAIALVAVQKELKSINLGLKIFDAYRPQQAVNHFVRWGNDLKDEKMKSIYYPEVEKRLLFQEGYISSRSGHSRGSTVDLTLIYIKGENLGDELDMGTPWDFFSPKSWPSSTEVTAIQYENRLLLQKIMRKYGFRPYSEEWWHFTLINEPFPDTYFDFPVK